jgi:hypothetical protein
MKDSSHLHQRLGNLSSFNLVTPLSLIELRLPTLSPSHTQSFSSSAPSARTSSFKCFQLSNPSSISLNHNVNPFHHHNLRRTLTPRSRNPTRLHSSLQLLLPPHPHRRDSHLQFPRLFLLPPPQTQQRTSSTRCTSSRRRKLGWKKWKMGFQICISVTELRQTFPIASCRPSKKWE